MTYAWIADNMAGGSRKDVMLLRRRGQGSILTFVVAIALISTSFPTTAACYKIKQGDTLWDIAARHHTTVAKLAKANRLRENAVLPLGKSIIIPGTTQQKQPSRRSIPSRQMSATVHTTVDAVCLRAGGSTTSRKIATLQRGTTLRVLYRNGKWAKVALANGVCGFVYRPLLAAGPGYSTPTRSSDTIASTEPERNTSSVVRTALAYRGTRYARGGTGRGGFDCSGFTRYVYSRFGIKLPHSSAAQAGLGIPVSRDDLEPGDLVFFQTSRRGISHVGIYIGEGKFVHASNHGRGVTVDSLGSSYYGPRYRGARRIK